MRELSTEKFYPDEIIKTYFRAQDAGAEEGKGSESGGLEVLDLLTSTHAALWLHDPLTMCGVIEKAALKQFGQHRDSMKVCFLTGVAPGGGWGCVAIVRLQCRDTHFAVCRSLKQNVIDFFLA